MTARSRAVAGWIGQVAVWLFIFAVGAILLAAVVVPRLGGAVPYTVLTGSMRPTIPEGSLIVVRPTDPAAIGVGEVITFQLESGKPDVATHRVTAISQAINGERLFTTKGDANEVADAEVVRGEQIVGTRWYSVPWLGHVNQWIGGPQRDILLGVVVTGLIGYAAFMFVGSLRDRRTAAAVQEQQAG